ncbi:MAG: ABC transporter ATP-binding protein [Candidatus Methanomethylicaceae archaeon]
MDNSHVLLEYRGLEVIFEMSGLKVNALRGIDLEVYRGEVLGIMGESGSGKTVLLQSTLRLLPENAKVKGKIVYKGQNLLDMRENEFKKILGTKFSMIPQGFGSLNPCLKNWLQISERPIEHFGKSKNEGYNLTVDLLSKLGVSDPARIAKNYRQFLSGGMLQRVLVAMGISANSEVLFIDEPTKGLDLRMRKLVIDLINISRKAFDSMIVVSHDLDFLKEIVDRICVLYCGDVVEVCDKREFFNSPRHPYSQALLMSLPSKGLIPIPGESPSMTSPPTGCSFHPRCKYSNSTCKKEKPSIFSVNGGKVRCHLYGQDQQ